MNTGHKIFFIGVVILSVAAGSRFNDTSGANGNPPASIIVSTSDQKPIPENSSPVATVEPAAQNDSTTGSNIQVSGQPEILSPAQDNSKSALNNDALLKSDSASGIGAFRQTGSEAPPEIQAQSALVADLKTGEVYFRLNPTLRWPTASLTKLMTAMIALKNIDLAKPVKIGEENAGAMEEATHSMDFPQSDSGQAGQATSAAFFKPGDVYSGNDVLAAMLIISKNEAAEAFADAYGRADFMMALNAEARDIGMSSTNFSDPSGLSVANQSTALDLQKLVLNIYRNYPKIFDITRKKSATITELNSKKKITLSNINTFAGTTGFTGGKTGYTGDANGNILSVFSYGGRPVLVIVLGTDDSFGETSAILEWFEKNFQKS